MNPYSFTGPREPGESWTARHDRMVAELPASGGTLIVITNEIGRYLIKWMRWSRGFAVRKKWSFIVIRHRSDCGKLEGLRGLVIVDWTVAHHAKPDALERLRVAIEQAAAMLPDG